MVVFKTAQTYIWAISVGKIVTNIFKKSPNLVARGYRVRMLASLSDHTFLIDAL